MKARNLFGHTYDTRPDGVARHSAVLVGFNSWSFRGRAALPGLWDLAQLVVVCFLVVG